MIERTTASLHVRACESLRHARQAPRNRRAWSAQLNDCALSNHESAVRLQHAPPSPSASPACSTTSSSCSWTVPDATKPDEAKQTPSPFLEFLWPPATLDWIRHRNALDGPQSQNHYPWRPYQIASRTSTRSLTQQSSFHSSAKSLDEARTEDDRLPQSVLERDDEAQPLSGKPAARDKQPESAPPQDKEKLSISPASRTGSANRQGGQSTTSPSPGEDEGHHQPDEFEERKEPEELKEPPLVKLRNLLRQSRFDKNSYASRHVTSMAWAWYHELEEAEQSNTQLKSELILWFARHQRLVDRDRCLQLFESLEIEARTLRLYVVAASFYFQHRAFATLLRMHLEALTNISNGHQLTPVLFRKALRTGRYSLAMHLYLEHHRTLDGPKHASERALFWYHIAGVPNLLHSTSGLVHYLDDIRRSKYPPILAKKLPALRRLALDLSIEAIKQHLMTSHNKGSIETWQSRQYPAKSQFLLDFIHRNSSESSAFLEKVLDAMFANCHSQKDYAALHPIITFAFRYYTRASRAKPSIKLLTTWLRHLTDFMLHRGALGLSTADLRIRSLALLMQTTHSKLSLDVVKVLMSYYARSGSLDQVDYWYRYLQTTYPSYKDQQPLLHSLVYLHARRADVPRAEEAFATVQALAEANGSKMSSKTYGALMHAYARVDDIAGAVKLLERMLSKRISPTVYTLTPIAEMMARRGDVQSVQILLKMFAQASDEHPTTNLVSTLIAAYVKFGDLEEAEATLKSMMQQVRADQVRGPLTGGFNILFTAYGLRRDLNNASRIYHWMKDEKVPMNSGSFSALVKALAMRHLATNALGIVERIMPSKGIPPTAFHYAIVMTALVMRGKHQLALTLHARMLKYKVQPSPASIRAYLSALAMFEHKTPRSGIVQPQLTRTLAELSRTAQRMNDKVIAVKEPVHGFEASERSTAKLLPYDILIKIHGTRQCLNTVRTLFQDYQAGRESAGLSTDLVPMRLLSALMHANCESRQWRHVKACWDLARSQSKQANRDRQALGPSTFQTLMNLTTELSTQPNNVENISSDTAIHAEIGFEPSEKNIPSTPTSGGIQPVIRSEPGSADTSLATASNSLQPASADAFEGIPVAAPADVYSLTKPLFYYLRSLAAQSRIDDCISTVTQVLQEGYKLDNRTWNRFIVELCKATPPLVLLAFTLTERFLVPEFPGWENSAKFRPKFTSRVEGMEYIKARYLRPEQLVVQYATMVHLGAALLGLRRLEAQGGTAALPADKLQFVGTMREIREKAPRTLFEVQSMPYANDKIQSTLLRPGM